MRGSAIALVLSAVAALCGWWLWSSETGRMLTGRWTFTEKVVVDRGTYFRLKVDLTYNGEPQHFDIVVGCNVLDIQYKDSSSTHEVGLVPTLYGRRMSDGKGLVVRAPDACDGETTANGEVPASFTPLIIVYENADSLEFGAAYLSEDAYDGPLSQLRFGKASIEAATRAEFEAFRRSGAPNLIEPAQYKPWLDKTKSMQLMATTCFAVKRYRVPEQKKESLSQLRPPASPRFWWLGKGETNPIAGNEYQRDDGGPEQYPGDFMGESLPDSGAPRRSGEGVIGGRRVPPSFYPISIPKYGLPEGHGPINPIASKESSEREYVVDAHIENGRYRGFAYCFWPLDHDPMASTAQRVDSEIAAVVPVQTQLSVGPFFDRELYMYFPFSLNIDSTRGGV